jgi:hypothetical protein
LSVAQTNLQLYAQLRAAGYAAQDLSRVADAYQLAMVLFSGQFRASGKTFLAHLIGTASLVASVGARVEVVVAALLHAAYDAGDFGTLRRNISSLKRRRLQAVVGAEAESLIVAYSALKWTSPGITRFIDQFSAKSPSEREAMRIRLANEVEEYLDDGQLYVGEHRQAVAAALAVSSGSEIVTLAGLLGAEALGDQLRDLQMDHVARMGTLVAPTAPPDSSYLVPPLICGRPVIWMSRVVLRQARRVVRSIAST